jgi:hypothetical protein
MNNELNKTERRRKWLLPIFFMGPFLISGCSATKPPVYIPQEYRSPAPPNSYSTSQVPAAPAPRADVPQGPVITSTPEFKKQDIPTAPASQPPTSASPQIAPPPSAQAPHQPSAQSSPRQQEEQSPQLLASMQLVNQASPS